LFVFFYVTTPHNLFAYIQYDFYLLFLFQETVLQAWAAKQQEYYNWIKRKNTGEWWIVRLIKKMWEISWNMWEQRNGELKNPELPASLCEHTRLAEYTDQDTIAVRDRR
jgi:hypothetical protein